MACYNGTTTITNRLISALWNYEITDCKNALLDQPIGAYGGACKCSGSVHQVSNFRNSFDRMACDNGYNLISNRLISNVWNLKITDCNDYELEDGVDVIVETVYVPFELDPPAPFPDILWWN